MKYVYYFLGATNNKGRRLYSSNSFLSCLVSKVIQLLFLLLFDFKIEGFFLKQLCISRLILFYKMVVALELEKSVGMLISQLYGYSLHPMYVCMCV